MGTFVDLLWPQGEGLDGVPLWTCSGYRDRDWMGYLCGPALAPGRGTGWGTFVDLILPRGEGQLLLQHPLLPLAHHLVLEAGHGHQELLPRHVRRWEHDTAVQELVDPVQQILPVVCKVGHLVEVLAGGPKSTK